MTQQTRVQQKFGGGELDPRLEERYDIQQYDSSISSSLNVMATNKGELISRPGSEVVKALDNTDDKTRIIPFIFDNDTTFRLEFTNGTLKIYQGSTQITSTTRYNFLTSRYCPAADRTAHFAGGEAPKNFPYQVGDEFTINTDSTSTLTIEYSTDGGVTSDVPVTNGSTVFEVAAINVQKLNGGGVGDFPMLDDVSIYEQGGSTELTLHVADSTLTANELYWEFTHTEWTSPYLESELQDIQYAQAGDIMFFAHGNHQPMKLERVGDTDFTFSPHYTVEGPWKPESTYDLKWDISSHAGQNSQDPGTQFTIVPNEITNKKRVEPDYLAGRMIRVTTHSTESQYGPEYLTAQIESVNQSNDELTSIVCRSWVPHNSTTTAYDMGAAGSSTDIDRIKIGYLFEDDPGDGTGSWPSCVAIWENRLIYAGSDTHPTAIAFSRKNDFDNFEPDDGGRVGQGPTDVGNGQATAETTATDGFVYVLSEGDASKIKWVKGSTRGLLVGTSRAIHVSVRPNSGENYGATNFDMKLASQEGTSGIQPVFANGRAYYVSESKTKLMSIGFDFASDAYSPKEESVFAEHLLEDGIEQIAYARQPIQCIWITTRTGGLVSMVFLPEQEQIGFFNHKLGGPSDVGNRSYVYSICVLPNSDFGPSFDQLYMTVIRPTTYCDSYVERLSPYPMGLDPNLFNTLDMAMTPFTDGTFYTVTLFSTAISSPNEVQAIATSSNHGLTTNDQFSLGGFRGGLTYLNGGPLATAESPTATTNIFTRDLPNGTDYSDSPPHFSGDGWVFTQTATYTNTDSRWDYAPTVIEKGRVLTAGTDYTLTNNQTVTFTGTDHGYMAFVGYAPEVYVTTLPDSRANQQGRGEANLGIYTDMTLKVRNTRNLTVRRLGGSLDVPMLSSPETESAGDSSILVNGKYSLEVEQIQDDFEGKFKISPTTGYPFTLQSIYLRGERASR